MNSQVSRISNRKSAALFTQGTIFLAVLMVGCSSSQNRPIVTQGEVIKEYRMKEDRDQLEKLRKDIPQQQQSKNDELAFIIKKMAGETRNPSEIQSDWYKSVRVQREKFTNKARKVREDFNADEKKAREDFLKKQKSARDDLSSKATRDERSEFYAEQDRARQNFFANERDRRKAFESMMTQERADFEDIMRDQSSQFALALKEYKANRDLRIQEEKKLKNLKK